MIWCVGSFDALNFHPSFSLSEKSSKGEEKAHQKFPMKYLPFYEIRAKRFIIYIPITNISETSGSQMARVYLRVSLFMFSFFEPHKFKQV